MYDTSSSSSSESDHEDEEENSSRLSRKLQETPSLAKVKDSLSLEEANKAVRISDVPIGAGVFIGGVVGKSRMTECFGASAKKKQRSARIRRKDIEKEVMIKQIREARQRKTFKRAIIISSSEDEEGKWETEGVRASKRWNIISSGEEEEDSIRKAGSQCPDNENNSAETGQHLFTTSKNVDTQEAPGREEAFFTSENTSPSSSLGPSPPNSPSAECDVQKALNYIKERRKENFKAKKREEEMLEEMLLRLLDERGRRCKGEGEKELLCMAAHILRCNGCHETRYNVGSFCSKGH